MCVGQSTWLDVIARGYIVSDEVEGCLSKVPGDVGLGRVGGVSQDSRSPCHAPPSTLPSMLSRNYHSETYAS